MNERALIERAARCGWQVQRKAVGKGFVAINVTPEKMGEAELHIHSLVDLAMFLDSVGCR